MSLITHNRIGAMIDEVCHKKKHLNMPKKWFVFVVFCQWDNMLVLHWRHNLPSQCLTPSILLHMWPRLVRLDSLNPFDVFAKCRAALYRLTEMFLYFSSLHTLEENTPVKGCAEDRISTWPHPWRAGAFRSWEDGTPLGGRPSSHSLPPSEEH